MKTWHCIAITAVTVAAVTVCCVAGTAHAAHRTVLGSSLLVKDPQPAAPEKRKLVVQGNEPASPDLIVGDPTASGASITIFLDGTVPATATYQLPQGLAPSGKPFWKATKTGFAYKDKTGVNGPVKTARLARSGSGALSVTAIAAGKAAPISLMPPNTGTRGCVRLDVSGGDSYHVLFGDDASISKNDARTFLIQSPVQEGLCCPAACEPLDGCHDAGTCNPDTGVCSNPPKPDDSPCSDGNLCTGADRCVDGICQGLPRLCADPPACHDRGTCDTTTGECLAAVPMIDGASCDDGDLTTKDDACQAGQCIGQPYDCTAPDLCHENGTHNGDGTCTAGPPLATIHPSNPFPVQRFFTVSGAPGTTAPGATVEITNHRTLETVTATAAENGSFSGDIAGIPVDTFSAVRAGVPGELDVTVSDTGTACGGQCEAGGAIDAELTGLGELSGTCASYLSPTCKLTQESHCQTIHQLPLCVGTTCRFLENSSPEDAFDYFYLQVDGYQDAELWIHLYGNNLTNEVFTPSVFACTEGQGRLFAPNFQQTALIDSQTGRITNYPLLRDITRNSLSCKTFENGPVIRLIKSDINPRGYYFRFLPDAGETGSPYSEMDVVLEASNHDRACYGGANDGQPCSPDLPNDCPDGTCAWERFDVIRYTINIHPHPLVNTLDDHDDGTCSKLDCTLREAMNAANKLAGGIIRFSVSGTITLQDELPTVAADMTIDGEGQNVTISGNDAVRVFSVDQDTTLSLSRLTVADGSADEGGAIRCDACFLNIDRCTLRGNFASSSGGAIYTTGATSISNSTFVGNVATGAGGAIHDLSAGQVTATHVTFADNVASTGNALCGTGGFFSTLLNSIVVGGGGSNCCDVSVFGEHSVSTDASCGGATQVSAAAINLDPAGLQDNGGPTRTIAVLPPSAAIDAADGAACAAAPVGAVDQRGYDRVGACDIGAFEVGATSPEP
ncbi:MAG TPA: choice-of-anchor Q domain-containing protein [Candidatus Limnocylindrales bacterium]|nr:choice-of-anchor Q domain-containing protein [Candidatus Limnocylindrales bacterium]